MFPKICLFALVGESATDPHGYACVFFKAYRIKISTNLFQSESLKLGKNMG
jgi:hypothetical protein